MSLDALSLQALFNANNSGSSGKKKKEIQPREALLLWLDQFIPGDAPDHFAWADYIQDYTTDPESAPDWAVHHKVQFILKLCTRHAKYLVLIKEAADSGKPPIFIISVSVNPSEDEKKARAVVDQAYRPAMGVDETPSDHSPRTIWAENFESECLIGALDRTAAAMLRHELTCNGMGEPVKRPAVEKIDDISADDLVEGFKLLPPEKKKELLDVIAERKADPKVQDGQSKTGQYEESTEDEEAEASEEEAATESEQVDETASPDLPD